MARFFGVALLCFFGVLSQEATAQSVTQQVSNSMTPDRFGPVQIVLNDSATNRCWTNLNEARSLAEAELAGPRIGMLVLPEAPGKLIIAVSASRTNGVCTGTVLLELSNEELGNESMYGFRTAECSSSSNCNVLVKYQVLKFAEAVYLAGKGWDVTE